MLLALEVLVIAYVSGPGLRKTHKLPSFHLPTHKECPQ